MLLFSELKKELRTYLPKDQIRQIQRAYVFSHRAHKGQRRQSGKHYITHPVAVAKILAKMRMDHQSIIAAILHDVIEDTPTDSKSLSELFGEEVTKLVDGVSKLTHIHFESYAQAKAENFRKMIMAMAKDIRVILIKLADRLHNMHTLSHLNYKKRIRIAKETLEIYAPIANRLGMHNFRLAFEDLGFAALFPRRCQILQNAIKEARGHRKKILSTIEGNLRQALRASTLANYQCYGREKHLYSIYKKMRFKHLPFADIMDIYAFRVTVQSVEDCYRVLGIVHNLYKPFLQRFKDYIAIPKINGYQSLHTTLFGPYGVPIEIQIRTESMDKMAENGIAAHWLYKADESIADKSQLRAREWIKGLLEIQQSAGNALEFIESVKTDLFTDEVYVFTPKGNIIELPRGATAIDFAYQIHSDIGNKCVAAKIDRRLAPLSTRLENGQTVKIITSQNAYPNPIWLNFVVTGKARGKIRHFLKQQKHSESIALGKQLVEKALAIQHIFLSEIPKENLKKLFEHSKFKTLNDLFEDVGLGNQPAQIAASRLTCHEDFKLTEAPHLPPLAIKGSEGLVIHFANCCRPVPGDPIEGILTAGRGIVVHHAECRNLTELQQQPDKCIPLRWEDNVEGIFKAKIDIELIQNQSILANLAVAVANQKSSIVHINLEEHEDQHHIINLVITVRDNTHLASIIRRLRHLKNVVKVSRNCNA